MRSIVIISILIFLSFLILLHLLVIHFHVLSIVYIGLLLSIDLLAIINVIGDVQDWLIIVVGGGLDRLVLLLDILVVSLELLCESVLDNASHTFEFAFQVLQLFVAGGDRLLYISKRAQK